MVQRSGHTKKEKETYNVLMRADVRQQAVVMRGLCHLVWEAMTGSEPRPWVTFGITVYLFIFVGRYIIESTENPFAIPMQSSLIHEEIGWSGYLYLSKCLLM